MKRLPAALATIGTLFSALSSVALSGVIRGTVVDEVGQPIQAAKVHAELHGVGMAKAIRYVESDENGAFAIDRLDYGTYDVNGQKEEDVYPDTSFSFSTDKPLAAVQISPDRPIATVALKLGPKAAIMSGTVRDALTGKPIPVGFMLRRADNPEEFPFNVSTSNVPHSDSCFSKCHRRGFCSWIQNLVLRGRVEPLQDLTPAVGIGFSDALRHLAPTKTTRRRVEIPYSRRIRRLAAAGMQCRGCPCKFCHEWRFNLQIAS
jgi:hypothetical protein